MTVIRRLSQLAGAAAVGAVGVLLILEGVDAIGGGWRRDLADALATVAFPTVSLWVIALAGFGLALVGVVLVAAQLAPPRKGVNRMHNVYRGDDGETRIAGRAAISAARHELEQIEGVEGVSARVQRKQLTVEVEVDDRADLVAIESEARSRLGHEFWINLGLADFALNLLIVHHPKPPRVR